MKKLGIVTACFLGATNFTTFVAAQGASAPAAAQDVAQILYQANKDLLRQQGRIEKAHEAVLEAHNDYIAEPNAYTYKALLRAAQNDAKEVATYQTLVNQAKATEKAIEVAERVYYEETPASQQAIETGPVGKQTPSQGESVENEAGMKEEKIVKILKEELEANQIEGEKVDDSPFARALKAQKEKLQKLQDRIIAESETNAVRTNPTAQKQNNELADILARAIDARRKALKEEEDDQASSKTAKPIPQNRDKGEKK